MLDNLAKNAKNSQGKILIKFILASTKKQVYNIVIGGDIYEVMSM